MRRFWFLALLLSACANVSPAERGRLASPCMQLALGETPLSGELRSRVLEAHVAGGLPGTAPGGGCGCTQ